LEAQRDDFNTVHYNKAVTKDYPVHYNTFQNMHHTEYYNTDVTMDHPVHYNTSVTMHHTFLYKKTCKYAPSR